MFPVRSTTAPAASPSVRALLLGLGLASATGPACTRPEPSTAPTEHDPPPSPSATRGEVEPDPVATAEEDGTETEAEPETAPRVHVERGGDEPLVYVELTIHPGDLVTTGPSMERDLAHAFSDGGQFEIFVRPQLLPVETPECPDGLIVRMPWTNPELAEAETAVERKRDLFSRLMEVHEGRRSSARVVLELDPYVTVSTDEPPRIALSRCTVFFRYEPGTYAYIDHLPDTSS